MATTKQEMSTEINSILGVDIDWTKLTASDLEKVHAMMIQLDEMVLDMGMDKVEGILKGKVADRLLNPGDNTIRGMIRQVLSNRPVAGRFLGEKTSDGKSNTPIVDAFRERIAGEIRNADVGPGIIRDAVKGRLKEQLK